MKLQQLLPLIVALLPGAALAGTITATYTAPTLYTDGTPVDRPITYVLYAAPEGQSLVEVQRSTTLILTITAAPGRWCAQVFAVNGNVWSDGAPRTPACVTVPPPSVPAVSKKPQPAGAVVLTASP